MENTSIENEQIKNINGVLENTILSIFRCKKCVKLCLPPYSYDIEGTYICLSCMKNESAPYNEYIFTKFEMNMLSKIILRCKYFSIGCDKEFQYNEAIFALFSHQNDCEFNKIKCSFCEDILNRSNYENHLKICRKYNITCQICGTQYKNNENHNCINSLLIKNQILNEKINNLNKKNIKPIKKKRNAFSTVETNGIKLRELGNVKIVECNYKVALNILEKSLEKNLSILGPFHEETANSYYNLADILKEMCFYQKALTMLNRCLEVKSKSPSIKLSIFEIVSKKIKILYLLNDFQRAENESILLLEMIEKECGEKAIQKIPILNQIGKILIKKCKYQEAINHFKKIEQLCINDLYYGLEYSNCLIHLADVYVCLDNYNTAQELFEKAILINFNLNLVSGKDKAKVFERISSLFLIKGESEKALIYLKRSLQIINNFCNKKYIAKFLIKASQFYFKCQQNVKGLANLDKGLIFLKEIFGENHKCVADAYFIYSEFNYKKGEYQLANEYITKSYQIYYNIFGKFHENISKCEILKGEICFKSKKFEEVDNYFDLAYEIISNIFTDSHKLKAIVYSKKAELYMVNDNDLVKVEEFFEKSLNENEKIFGKDSLELIPCILSIGFVKIKQEKFKEAVGYFKRNISILINSGNQENIAEAYHFLGYIYFKRSKYFKSIKYYYEAIKLWRSLDGEDSIKESRECYFMSFSLLKDDIKLFREAEVILKKGLEIVTKKFSEKSLEAAKFLKRMGFLYRKLNKNEDSLKYFKKSKELYDFLNMHNESLNLQNLIIIHKEILEDETLVI